MSLNTSQSEPKYCCGAEPNIFTDVKSERTERMWVVACANCGSYSDAPTREGAINQWNMDYRKKNPIDIRFVGRLGQASKK